MQRWLLSAVLGVVFGSVAVLAQGQPQPGDEHRPPPPPFPPQQQQMMHQHMMQQQMAMQQQMQCSQPRCPLGRHACPLLAVFVVCTLVIHILLAVWVYQDIRRRNAGSGIWVVITLLTGLCGAAVYALVRLGEKQA